MDYDLKKDPKNLYEALKDALLIQDIPFIVIKITRKDNISNKK